MMPPKPKKKKGDQARKVHAKAQPSSDDDLVEEELNVDYGQIPNVFRLIEPREDWLVTKESLKSSPIVPQISNNKNLKDHLGIGTACNPHLMNRFGLVSWYVFFVYCIGGLVPEVMNLKKDIELLKKKNEEANNLIFSLRSEQSKKHTINDITSFKTNVVRNIIVPHLVRDVLFRIGFLSKQVSSIFCFNSFLNMPPHNYFHFSRS
jgi:hypothetical protein